MFAGMKIPVLGDAQAFNATLEKLGLDAVQSLSAAMVPEAGGFKSSVFLHLPGAAASKNPWLNRKALVSDDIAVVPRNADWASVINCDLAASYSSVLGMVRSLAPEADETVSSAIAEIEKRIGVSIEKDLLGAFEGNLAIFDSPDNGGFWFSGTILVAKVKRDNQLSKALRNIAEAIAEEIGKGTRLVMGKEEYRGQKIEYVTLSGIPLPVAPAWAEFQGRWVFALFPQMVRTELDHLMNRAPSLLDNPDFQRGRQLLPAGAFAVTYVDTRVGFRQLYSFALPIAQMGAAMLHKEDIPFDVGMLPSWQVINRHLFGNVSASVVNDR
jgi:hypothetical protein